MEIIQMPRIGGFVEKGQISKRHKQLGQLVRPGELIVEVDLGTITLELESPIDGQILYYNENTIFSDEVITIIGEESSNWEEYLNQWQEINSKDIVFNKVDFFKTKIAVILSKHTGLDKNVSLIGFDELLEKLDILLDNVAQNGNLKKKRK
ncbi:MAG: biotin/lipoyl-containing protein [Bacteroidota bacterium]